MKKIFSFILAIACSVGAYASSITISGTVNASSLQEGAEIVIAGNTEIFMDVTRSIKKITGDYSLVVSGERTLIIKSDAHGISVGSFVSSGVLEISSKKDGLNIDRDIKITGGKISIDADGDAIYSRNTSITIDNARINCICGTNMSAIYAPKGNIKITNSEVEARGAKYGIISDAGIVTLSGNITATAGGWAIVANMNVNLNGGTIIARSSGTPILSSKGSIIIDADVTTTAYGDGAAGMFARSSITINSGNVSATCSDNGSAISSDGLIQINGGKVEAYGAKHGIYSEESAIAIQAPVYAKAAGWAILAGKTIAVNYPYVLIGPSNATLNSSKTTYVVGSRPATKVRIDMKPLNGSLYFKDNLVAVGQDCQCLIGGEASSLVRDYGLRIVYTFEASLDGENNWSPVASGSENTWHITKTYLGAYLRVRATSPDCDGMIFSPVMQITKSANPKQVVQAQLRVDGTDLYLDNPQTDQEYMLLTAFQNIDNLYENYWKDNGFTPTSTSSMKITQAKANATNYVYTRTKETDIYKVGTDIRLSYAYTGTATYLQNIFLTVTKANGTSLEQESRSYYTKVGDVVKVTANAVPDNATNYNGIYYDKWFTNSHAGTFYSNAACTQALTSGSYYKTIYFKPNKQDNYVDVTAEFTKGYNDIAHDAINLYVADANGDYLATRVDGETFYIMKGNKQTGLHLTPHPSKARTSNFTFTLNSGSGTAPVVTAQNDGSFTIDATNATKGTYYYKIKQGTHEVGNGLTVQVTNAVIEEVVVTPTSITVEPGDEFQLQTEIFPANTGDDITYSSSHTGVATVSTTGLVKISANAEVAATAIITAKAGGKTAKCLITVAGQKFDVTIDGTQVTTRNMTDVLSDGAFAFDGISTLSVQGDYTTNKQLIVSSIKGLNLDVQNDAQLTSSAVVLNLTKDATITGEGTLTLTNTSTSSIQVPAVKVGNGATLTLKHANVVAEGGVLGDKSGASTLRVNASNLRSVAQSGKLAVAQFAGGIELTDCEIKEPAKAIVDNAQGAISNPDGLIPEEVIIKSTYTSLEDIMSDTELPDRARKLLIDGTLYIQLSDGRLFDAMGVLVSSFWFLVF